MTETEEHVSVERVREERQRLDQIALAGLAWWHEGRIHRRTVESDGMAVDVLRISYGYVQTVHLDNWRRVRHEEANRPAGDAGVGASRRDAAAGGVVG